MKGGSACGNGDGACTLHAESGFCPFPALPRPLNFPSDRAYQCRSQCPPPNCPPNKCPPRPVESCVPASHPQYMDFYPECKETPLPVSSRACAENDDLYLPSSSPCRGRLHPPTAPPTQRCSCPCPSPPTCSHPVVDPCPPQPPGNPPKVDCGCCSPPTPKLFSSPDDKKSRCYPTPPRCPPGRAIPSCRPSDCRSDPVEPCWFPSPPRCPLSFRTPPRLKLIALPSLPGSLSGPPSPKGSCRPPQADPCCSSISSRLPESRPPSCPKRVALAAQVNPPLPDPAPVGTTDLDTLPKPADASKKPRGISSKPVQRIYVCLPYPVNLLSTSPEPLPSDNEKIPPPPCQECITPQVSSPRSPKLPPSRSVSPIKPIVSGPRQLATSGCQYSPRVDTERPKLLMTPKKGPSPPRVKPVLPESVQINSERPASPSVQRPETASTPGKRVECTCQKPDHKRRSRFYHASQLKTRSQSPSQSSGSPAQRRRMETATNDVKRVLNNDLPSRTRQSDVNRGLYSSRKPDKDMSDQNREVSSSGRTTDRNQGDLLSNVRSKLKPELPSSSSGRTTDRKRDPRQEFDSPGTYCQQEDFSSRIPPQERRRENFMVERGSSPNTAVDRPNTSFATGPGMAPNENTHSVHKRTDPRQSGHDHTKESSTCNIENSAEKPHKSCHHGDKLVSKSVNAPCCCATCSYPFPHCSRKAPMTPRSQPQSRRQKERHPSPRALLKSLSSYLSSQRCHRSKAPQRKPCHEWKSPPKPLESKYSSPRSSSSVPRGLQQAPLGTHPILMCSRPFHSRSANGEESLR